MSRTTGPAACGRRVSPAVAVIRAGPHSRTTAATPRSKRATRAARRSARPGRCRAPRREVRVSPRAPRPGAGAGAGAITNANTAAAAASPATPNSIQNCSITSCGWKSTILALSGGGSDAPFGRGWAPTLKLASKPWPSSGRSKPRFSKAFQMARLMRRVLLAQDLGGVGRQHAPEHRAGPGRGDDQQREHDRHGRERRAGNHAGPRRTATRPDRERRRRRARNATPRFRSPTATSSTPASPQRRAATRGTRPRATGAGAAAWRCA